MKFAFLTAMLAIGIILPAFAASPDLEQARAESLEIKTRLKAQAAQHHVALVEDRRKCIEDMRSADTPQQKQETNAECRARASALSARFVAEEQASMKEYQTQMLVVRQAASQR